MVMIRLKRLPSALYLIAGFALILLIMFILCALSECGKAFPRKVARHIFTKLLNSSLRRRVQPTTGR